MHAAWEHHMLATALHAAIVQQPASQLSASSTSTFSPAPVGV
jgi:hypothetical protein